MNIVKNLIGGVVVLALFTLGSCEDDFSTVGADIIGGTNFNTEPYDMAEITSYSKKITSVQTNGLPQYLLGAYSDPIYGLSEASILTQLSLSIPNPDFGADPVLDSVVLVLPYYSTAVEQTEEGTLYELDSVYGGGPIKLSVYTSNYFLRDLDPESNFEDEQLYYSNQQAEFENNLGPFLAQETISPNNQEVVLFREGTGVDEQGEPQIDTLHLSPRLRIHLPVDYFQLLILNQAGTELLLSNANFQSYFRGLYLKAEAIDGGGHMAAFNLNNQNAKVVLFYTNAVDDPTQEDDSTTEVHNTFVLTFQGNKVNVYDTNFQVDLSNQDSVNGEPNLYLKGGEGSMAVIELFSGPDTDGDGVSDELEDLREKDWLINEANLTFVVNENLIPAGTNQPERIFIYDLKNNEVLLDYNYDFTANENNPLISRTVHLGRLKEDGNGNLYYKIRLTGHIRNIINLDSTNVKLGLTISSNVNFIDLLKLKNAEDEIVSKIPTASVLSPEGTVLYGNAAPNENKRLKLNIYYTEAK